MISAFLILLFVFCLIFFLAEGEKIIDSFFLSLAFTSASALILLVVYLSVKYLP